MARVMEHFVETFATHYGYVALFALMWIDTMGLPLPSEIPLLFAGYLIFLGKMAIVPAALISAAGCVGGSLLAYAVSRRFGRAAVLRWGKPLLITAEHLERSERWFERRGPFAVFICRMIPLARTLISIPAGIAEMEPVRFSAYTFAGSLPWAFGLMGLGWALGDSWKGVLHSFTLASAIVGVVMVAGAVWWILKRRRAAAAAAAALSAPPDSASAESERAR
jgi:membrane protein DedA with SNARE-associated domain